MSDQNKQVVRRFQEAFAAGDTALSALPFAEKLLLRARSKLLKSEAISDASARYVPIDCW